MKAAQFIGENKLTVLEKPRPEPKPGELLVKVAYCGLCGSEKRVLGKGFTTCTPGHETSGTVESCGSKDSKFKPGDEILIYFVNYCGECPACKQGKTTQCTNKGKSIGWGFDGGYAEYTVIPESMAFPLEGLPLNLGVIALDTIGTAFHGLRQCDIAPGQSVMVLGCGPIGLGAVCILKNHYKIDRLYAADISSYHLDLAKNFGAIPLKVDPADTAGSIAAQLNEPIDVIAEIVGADATFEAAIRLVRPDGKVVFIGEPEKDMLIKRNGGWLLKDFCLFNSWYFFITEIKDNLDFIRKNQAEVEKIITHEFPIEQMTEAFEIFCRGETGKVLIKQ